jgi:hypothetical protein
LRVHPSATPGDKNTLSADENPELRAGDGAGLARHRAAEALALKGSGDVGRRAASPEKAKESHDTSPCKIHTERPAWIDGGCPFDGVDIVIASGQISGKSEAGSIKNDISFWPMSFTEAES